MISPNHRASPVMIRPRLIVALCILETPRPNFLVRHRRRTADAMLVFVVGEILAVNAEAICERTAADDQASAGPQSA